MSQQALAIAEGASNALADRRRVAILVNIIAPYRIPVYDRIAKHFDTRVIVSGSEGNRGEWNNLQIAHSFTVKRSVGFTIKSYDREPDGVFDYKHTHITPGLLWDLMRFRPHAILSTEMGFRTLVALLYGFLTRTPVWIWWGGTLHTERAIGWSRKILRRFISKRARHWISYGQTSTDYLATLGVPGDRILQIQNCVDEGKFRDAKPTMEVEPRPVILHVGQLILRKGIGRLLGSAARLQAEGLEFTLVLVGSGPEEEKLRKRVDELGLRNVVFRGGARPTEMPGIYASADCVVFPTLEDVWGLVANEALWSGAPVIASRYAGCSPEIIPPQNVFDPLSDEDFDRVLKLAVTGQLAEADRSPLKTCDQVAKLIADEIDRVLQH